MRMTIVSVIAILVIIAIVVVLGSRKKPEMVPTTTPPTVTLDEETILESQINALTEEQLAAISMDLTDYSGTVENDMASSIGMFMYQ